MLLFLQNNKIQLNLNAIFSQKLKFLIQIIIFPFNNEMLKNNEVKLTFRTH